MSAEFTPRWRPTPAAQRLATVAVLALAAAFLTGHGILVAFAAGPLVLLVLAARAPMPKRIRVTGELDTTRCVEGDPVAVTVTVDAAPAPDDVSLRVFGPPSLSATPPDGQTVTVTPGRWGILPLTVRVTVSAGYRLQQADVDLDLGTLTVLPRAPRLRAAPASVALLSRLGEHPSRVPGSGIEFAGIREYRPGDTLRELNWSATSRRRQPLVNERAGERATDLVIAIDAFTDLATDQPSASTTTSTVDRSVRGAVGLAQSVLHHRDRVGLIVFGGVLRWLSPGGGARQFYRVAEAVLSARSLMFSVVRPDVTRLPSPALPPGALVVMFSPLADTRVFAALEDLRQRRLHTIVVDVLADRAPTTTRRHDRPDPLALRTWRLDRAADRHALTQLGIPVLAWPPGTDLATVLATVTTSGTRSPVAVSRRPA